MMRTTRSGIREPSSPFIDRAPSRHTGRAIAGRLASAAAALALAVGAEALVAAAADDEPLAFAQPPAVPGGDEGDKSKTSTNSDRDYIKAHITEYLRPTKIQFLKGGRLRLLFDFTRKDEAHEEIFVPPLKAGFKAAMRWSHEDEDMVIGGIPGIRLSDKGMALLNVWFEDELEAEIEFAQYINHSSRLVTAVVFCNERGISLGSNFGSQCAMFKGRKLAKRGSSKTASVAFNTTAEIKLVVKDGKFEARRGSSSKARDEMAYPTKSFSSGRVGILWGGSTAATVSRLEIVGKVDIEKTAALLRQEFEGS